jgi:cytoskeletal protein CcmA (bactofilin family)
MFRKATSTREHTDGSGRQGMPTIIGADFRVKGDISCEGDIQLEGTVDGNIKSLRLTVGPSGAVHGDVNAESVRVQGKIVGTIRAKSVELAGTGHVTGDILHEALTVENGAFLNGHCRRLTAAEILAEAEARDAAKQAREGAAKPDEAKKTDDAKQPELQVVSGGR